ncbi:hypothetical protein [Streptomyces sp. NPDC059786]|uniref:hypothetical protein n=1 Tax=Streptomyces sp. NPDC059786 TaxID=3346946 RepID=UPI003650008E
MATMAQALSVPQTEQTVSGLTAAQVCDLPMGELLALVNGRLDTIDTENNQYAGINPDRFLGYIVARSRTGITVYTDEHLPDAPRDAYIRYLITEYLGLPTHHFPGNYEVTVFTGPSLKAALA